MPFKTKCIKDIMFYHIYISFFYLFTGKYRAGDEKKISPEPHFVASDFSEAVDYIIKHTVTSGS